MKTSLHNNIIVPCVSFVVHAVYIGSALAEKLGQGEVGGCTPLGDSAWRLLQLAVEKPWSVRRVGQLSAHSRSCHCLTTVTQV